MASRKRLAGFALTTLGATGLVACCAAVPAAWIVGADVRQVASAVFGRAIELVARVDLRAGQAYEAVFNTRSIAEELKKTLRDASKEAVVERARSFAETNDLEQRLASAVDQEDRLLEVSASSAELMAQVLTLVGADPSGRLIEPENLAQLYAEIQATRATLATATERLSEVRRTLAENRDPPEIDVNRERVAQLTLGIVAKLDVVQTQLQAFRGRLEELERRLAQLSSRLSRWIFAAQVLLIVLLLWIAAGQYCLMRQGWRRSRRPSTA